MAAPSARAIIIPLTAHEALSGILGSISIACWIFLLVRPLNTPPVPRNPLLTRNRLSDPAAPDQLPALVRLGAVAALPPHLGAGRRVQSARCGVGGAGADGGGDRGLLLLLGWRVDLAVGVLQLVLQWESGGGWRCCGCGSGWEGKCDGGQWSGWVRRGGGAAVAGAPEERECECTECHDPGLRLGLAAAWEEEDFEFGHCRLPGEETEQPSLACSPRSDPGRRHSGPTHAGVDAEPPVDPGRRGGRGTGLGCRVGKRCLDAHSRRLWLWLRRRCWCCPRRPTRSPDPRLRQRRRLPGRQDTADHQERSRAEL